MQLYCFKNGLTILVADGNPSRIKGGVELAGAVVCFNNQKMTLNANGLCDITASAKRGGVHLAVEHNGVTYEGGIVTFDEGGNPKPQKRWYRAFADNIKAVELLQSRMTALEDRILQLENNFKYKGLDFLTAHESEDN